jgi:hypothetical protein
MSSVFLFSESVQTTIDEVQQLDRWLVTVRQPTLHQNKERRRRSSHCSAYCSAFGPVVEFIDPVSELKPALKWGWRGLKEVIPHFKAGFNSRIGSMNSATAKARNLPPPPSPPPLLSYSYRKAKIKEDIWDGPVRRSGCFLYLGSRQCMECAVPVAWKRRGNDLGEYLLRKGHDAFTIDSESRLSE